MGRHPCNKLASKKPGNMVFMTANGWLLFFLRITSPKKKTSILHRIRIGRCLFPSFSPATSKKKAGSAGREQRAGPQTARGVPARRVLVGFSRQRRGHGAIFPPITTATSFVQPNLGEERSAVRASGPRGAAGSLPGGKLVGIAYGKRGTWACSLAIHSFFCFFVLFKCSLSSTRNLLGLDNFRRAKEKFGRVLWASKTREVSF